MSEKTKENFHGSKVFFSSKIVQKSRNHTNQPFLKVTGGKKDIKKEKIVFLGVDPL